MAEINLVPAAVAAGAAVVSAVSQVTNVFWDKFLDKISHSNNMEVIHKELDEAMRQLRAIRDDYSAILHKSRATKRPSYEYGCWTDSLNKVEAEVKERNTRYRKKILASKCFCIIKRSNFCAKMKMTCEKVDKVYKTSRELGNILIEKDRARVIKMATAYIKEFPTLQSPLDEILGCLTNDKINCISVCGVVGTGKTTIMQNLNNSEKVAELFELVIWVNVSTEENNRNLSMEQIRQDILQRLKLNKECLGVADEIKEELRDTKFLLLLDGVKEDLDLKNIGMDLACGNGNKIVLTTTVRNVCHSTVDKVITVERLSEKEAWKMFEGVLGNSQANIGRAMPKVVQWCAGLPFAIKMIASAFKSRKTEESWNEGLDNLRLFPEKGDPSIQKMFKYLSFCCDDLEGAQRDCFLYSAIYPEDNNIHTDCLLDCWAAEDLNGSNDDAEKVRKYGRFVLNKLKTVSLLDECMHMEYVKMNKMIRQVALHKLLVENEAKHLVKTGQSLHAPPKVEHWKEKKWISLVNNKLKGLPEGPDCSMLSTLFLQENLTLKELNNLFFEKMENLRVLNLHRTGIVSLPSSISKLKRLKVLYLNDCTDLVRLPSQLEELESLEVLDIRGSGLEKISLNMEKLSCLTRLLVSFNNFGNERVVEKVLDHYCNLISSISTLEELVLDVKSGKDGRDKIINVVRDKVATALTNLKTLKFCFEDDVEVVIKVQDTTTKIYFPKAEDLRSYVEKIDETDLGALEVYVGCSISSSQIPNLRPDDSYLRYCNGESCNPTIIIGKVLAKSDAFELVSHSGLEHVSQLGTPSLDRVRRCLIESCNKISTVVDGDSVTDNSRLLPNLEELYMKKLPLLKSIWKGSLQPGSLLNLSSLLIEECFGIEELLTQSGNGILPSLRKLVLVNLQNLRRICANVPSVWPALEELTIHGCPNLTELPFNKDNAMKLRELILIDVHNLSICANVSFELPALQELKIHGCLDLIVLPFDKDNTKNLRKLTLLDLPNLTSLCANFSLEWPALEKLKMHGCPSLRKLHFNKDNAVKLRSIKASERCWEALNPTDRERLQHLYRSLR